MSRPNYVNERRETFKVLTEKPETTTPELHDYFSKAHTEINSTTIAGWKSLFNKKLLKEDGSASIPKTGTKKKEVKEKDPFDTLLIDLSDKYHTLKEENTLLKTLLSKWKTLAGKLQEDIQSLSREN